MERFLEFSEVWGKRYPAIVRLWENAWAEFVPFLAFDPEPGSTGRIPLIVSEWRVGSSWVGVVVWA